MADMIGFEQAVDQVILDSERLHRIVNGDSSTTVTVEDGSAVPTVRKALIENLYFKTPAIPWVSGTNTTVFNQLFSYNNAGVVQWWYAPGATVSTPVTLPANPNTAATGWVIYNDSVAQASKYAPIASPILTGTPQAPTPVASSNNEVIATTRYVTRAITTAISSIVGSDITYANLTVIGTTSLQDLTVDGDITFNRTVNADTVTGRFADLVLTNPDSTLTFGYTDPANPAFLKTQLKPYEAQTHSFKADIIVNGTASADNTTMSLTGVGNNTFDYVYIRGNSSKTVSEPRLKVTGITELENLRVTGTVTGINVSVNGLDILPRSVVTTLGVTVGTDLSVSGTTTLGTSTVSSLTVSTTLSVTGASTFTGGFTGTTGNLSGNLTVGGTSSLNGGFSTGTAAGTVGGALGVTGLATLSGGAAITGNLNVSGTVTAPGNVTLNGATGTTTVNNLVIQGTVSGLSLDFTGQAVTVGSLFVETDITVTETIFAKKAAFDFLTLTSFSIASPPATWTPDGTKNIYNVTVDKNITIGAWPVGTGAFSAMIYLTQDATGGRTVTLHSSYALLNSQPMKTTPNSVTILQLTYCGVGSIVDVVVATR